MALVTVGWVIMEQRVFHPPIIALRVYINAHNGPISKVIFGYLVVQAVNHPMAIVICGNIISAPTPGLGLTDPVRKTHQLFMV
jgi:hypothetical protein